MLPFNEMNMRARRFAKALVRSFPDFAEALRLLPGGHFVTQIPAPQSSKAGGLACCSVGDGDVWIQLAIPNAFYSVDDVLEMRRVVRALLTDNVVFVLISKNGKWHGTTLIEVGARPRLRAGEIARLVSWSGSHDLVVKPTRAPAAKRGVKRASVSSNASRSRPTSR